MTLRANGQPTVGREFAGYVIERHIAAGGMAQVYLARHVWLRRRVALKVLSPEYANDATFRERFVRESRHAAAIDHPNIVPVYEAGDIGGILYIAMRYIAGIDLRALLARQPRLDARRSIAILGQIASALDAAASHGLVHRDVKPANVLLSTPDDGSEAEHAYLADFGLTKRAEGGTNLTGAGQFVGTVDYIAPEQIEGEHVDRRADVYSLGCVLFECLTGAKPFARETEAATIFAHLLDPPPRATSFQPDLGRAVDVVFARALSKAADGRQTSCRSLIAEASVALGAGASPTPARHAEPTPRVEHPLRHTPPPPPPPVRRPTWRLGKPQ